MFNTRKAVPFPIRQRQDRPALTLIDCQETILREIADKSLHQRDIAQTYYLTLESSEATTVEWGVVNRAIIARWSESGLKRIKQLAWSGRCWR